MSRADQLFKAMCRTILEEGYSSEGQQVRDPDPGDHVLDHEEGQAPGRGHRQQGDEGTELIPSDGHRWTAG